MVRFELYGRDSSRLTPRHTHRHSAAIVSQPYSRKRNKIGVYWTHVVCSYGRFSEWLFARGTR